MVRYAALRIILLVVVGGLLYLTGMRSWLLAATAIIIAAMLSYILFPTQRNAAARRVEEISSKYEARTQIDVDTEEEDAAAESYHQEADEADGSDAEEHPKLKEDGSD